MDIRRRLIQNAIIVWNYLYITRQVFKATSNEREILIQSSPVRWKHINLHGTFDFSQEVLQNAINFDIKEPKDGVSQLINFDWVVKKNIKC